MHNYLLHDTPFSPSSHAHMCVCTCEKIIGKETLGFYCVYFILGCGRDAYQIFYATNEC
jgi:hypothetical protein